MSGDSLYVLHTTELTDIRLFMEHRPIGEFHFYTKFISIRMLIIREEEILSSEELRMSEDIEKCEWHDAFFSDDFMIECIF